ncbi:MAG: ATP-binding cassette domain-containing protein [Candidatus Omnitrophica bacterium]|nr:ATP-binding cassette domain-containing protein [Candidatus Omnitrophota bacterium]
MGILLQLDKILLNLEGRKILKNLSLSVEEGTIYSILGSNAAGKSSLAYVIMGCCDYFPQDGKIYFRGEDITSFSLSN